MLEILLNVESKELRYALLKHGNLYDLVIERKKSRDAGGNISVGNIYRGYVNTILPNIQSAFIDIGEGENGFIHISDILENTSKFAEMYDMDFEVEAKKAKAQQKANDIGALLKPGQPVLVQVVKEPMGTKGARLTSNVSIAGRYLVLLPNTSHRGVSRKIENASDRERLKKLIRAFDMPHDMGLICRTSSTSAHSDTLIEEAQELFRTWQTIVEGFQKASKPTLLFEESDLVRRALMVAVDRKCERLLVDDYATYQSCKQLYAKYATEHPLNIELYRDKMPMFERFNIEKEIEKALRKKIWLPTGGYIFFERTEAMCTVDVNSGRSTSKQGSASDVEQTLLKINLEAADEIARQLRLRNIGGLVVCDFIDMRSHKNQRRVVDRLKESMKDDGAKCTILGMSEFGLVEMTRQRSRESLSQTLFCACPYCAGGGVIKSHESVGIEIERALRKVILCQQQFALRLECHPELKAYLDKGEDGAHLMAMCDELHAKLEIRPNDTLHLNEFLLYSTMPGEERGGPLEF